MAADSECNGHIDLCFYIMCVIPALFIPGAVLLAVHSEHSISVSLAWVE